MAERRNSVHWWNRWSMAKALALAEGFVSAAAGLRLRSITTKVRWYTGRDL